MRTAGSTRAIAVMSVAIAGALVSQGVVAQSRSAPAVGPYVRAEVGYTWALNANFKEDDPASPDCFLFSATGGCGSTLDNLGSSVSYGIGIGYRISPLFRVDLSYVHSGNYNLQGWDSAGTYFDPQVSSNAVMFNGFFDIPYKFGDRVQPYVGLSVGSSRNKMNSLNWYDPGPPASNGTLNAATTNNSFAWQLTLGAAITVTDAWILDVGYRYNDMGEFQKAAGPDQSGNFTGTGFSSSAAGNLRTNEIFADMRYNF
jgi:opacity protein-like surface antigen